MAEPGSEQGLFDAVHRVVEELNDRTLVDFKANERIRSYREYLADLLAHPLRLGRNAAQYMVSMFEHYGREEVECVGRSVPRWKLFDLPFRDGRGAVQGQERAMHRIYRLVRYLAEKGRADRFLLLHGPNGSAKTSLVEAIAHGLEDYSHTPEGALFSFNWVFSERMEGSRLGFDPGEDRERADTYAYLDPEDISCLIPCELRDSPLFLLPKPYRRAILRKAASERGEDLPQTDYLVEGDLCQKCRGIFQALLNAYQGRWEQVIQHVQVERYFIAKRYRVGAVTIEPQRNVDAASRPTFREHNAYVPPILAHANLYEPVGDLVDANGGLVEYSDFLKRSTEANKYLLTTIEKGSLNLPGFLAYLNLVMLGTSNEFHLTAFKHTPDWPSFKGRMELVRVPYLLECGKEERVYTTHVHSVARGKHVAPHAARVAALWAVLTRLKRPSKTHFAENVGKLAERLTPLEKAKLYDPGETPSWCSEEERRVLLSHRRALLDEYDGHVEEFEGVTEPAYEGRRGASPREMLTLLADAATDSSHPCLSPMAIFDAIRSLTRETSVYDFLRLKPRGAYHDQAALLDMCRLEYGHIVLEEVRDAVGLVEESEYNRLFNDYFAHVKAYVRGEKVMNPTTRELQGANTDLLAEVERVLDLKESADAFRKGLFTRIAAYSLDYPDRKIDYSLVFPEILRALKEDFYRQRDKALSAAHTNFLKLGGPEFKGLEPARQREVERAMERMKQRYGYCEQCAREVIVFVSQQRDAFKPAGPGE